MNLGHVPSPAEALAPPPEAPGDWAQDARESAGLIVGGVDYAIKFLTGFSPLEEWVFKPLAGDWGALDRGAVAWTNAGRALRTALDNVNAVPGQVGDEWQGETADAFFALQNKVCTNLSDLPEACDEVSTMVSALSEAAQGIAALIGAAINEVANLALGALAAAAVPVAGWISEAGWVTKLVAAVGKWSTRLAQALRRFFQLVDTLATPIRKIYGVMVKIAAVLKNLNLVTTVKTLKEAVPSMVAMGVASVKAGVGVGGAAENVFGWDGV